jgi:hypothetical protein
VRFVLPLLLSLLFALLSQSPVLGQEEGDDNTDPWVGAPAPKNPDDEQPPAEQPEGDVANSVLFRCRMDGLESARYSVAQLQLKRSDVQGCIASLTQVVDGTANAALRDLTHFNLAEIHRRRLLDAAGAQKHYRLIEGVLRHKAQQQMLDMLADAGKADEAEKLVEELLGKAKEKGARLALLHRFALTYRDHQMPERCLAVYQRITKEFTPADMKEMLVVIRKEALAAAKRIYQAEMKDDPKAAQIREELEAKRLQDLWAAGRWDEHRVYEETLSHTLQRLQEEEEDAPEPAEMPAAEPKKPAEF